LFFILVSCRDQIDAIAAHWRNPVDEHVLKLKPDRVSRWDLLGYTDAHQFEILRALARWLSIERCPRDRDQFALAADREPWVIGIDHHSPPIQPQRSKALAKKTPLDDELADLGVQLRYFGFPADLRLRSLVVERLGQVLDGLPLPMRDLVRVKLVLRRQFRNRPLAADRLKRNLAP